MKRENSANYVTAVKRFFRHGREAHLRSLLRALLLVTLIAAVSLSQAHSPESTQTLQFQPGVGTGQWACGPDEHGGQPIYMRVPVSSEATHALGITVWETEVYEGSFQYRGLDPAGEATILITPEVLEDGLLIRAYDGEEGSLFISNKGKMTNTLTDRQGLALASLSYDVDGQTTTKNHGSFVCFAAQLAAFAACAPLALPKPSRLQGLACSSAVTTAVAACRGGHSAGSNDDDDPNEIAGPPTPPTCRTFECENGTSGRCCGEGNGIFACQEFVCNGTQ